MKEKLNIDDLIPGDLYCHGNLDYVDGRLTADYMCPFWRKIRGRRHQESGYCLYLQKGDWADSMGGMGLLWDQCKECGLKMEIDYSDMITIGEIPEGSITK